MRIQQLPLEVAIWRYHGCQADDVLSLHVNQIVEQVRVGLINEKQCGVIDSRQLVLTWDDELRFNDDVLGGKQCIQIVDHALVNVHQVGVTKDILDLGDRLILATPLRDEEGDASYHA